MTEAPTPRATDAFFEKPTDAALAEIEAERIRRQENRPPNSEVDNTKRVFNAQLGRFEDCTDPHHKNL